jgi:acid phosphatase (class A)
MIRARFLPTVLLALTFAAAARAANPYIQPGDIDIKSILPPPPANDSAQTKREIEHLLQLQSTRTDADIARIKAELKMTPFLFSEVLGSKFNPDDLPATAKFLAKVIRSAGSVSSAAKDIFKRDRPFNLDSRIQPCVEQEKTFSYPSGHSTRSMVVALVLAQIFPDHADALIARAKLVGDDRETAGEHFPSDVEAGRTLAKAIFEQMQKNPDFQSDFEKAKDECAAKESAK